MEINDCEILLIAVTFYLQHVWKVLSIVAMKKIKTE